jgi:hypothetical protein
LRSDEYARFEADVVEDLCGLAKEADTAGLEE